MREQAYSVADFREIAARRLPRGLFEFIDRGSEDETLLHYNRRTLERIRLRPRVLRNVAEVDVSTSLFGASVGSPFAIAPTGSAGLVCHEGEVALARAARAERIPFTLAMGSMTPLERIAKEVGGRLWFQFYPWRNRQLTDELIARAADHGYEGLVATVDTPVIPSRDYLRRSGFGVPFRLSLRSALAMCQRPRWLFGVVLREMLTSGLPRFANNPPGYEATIFDMPRPEVTPHSATLDWEEIRRLRDRWPRRLILKGILHPEDAATAVGIGADAIVVSNHGARVLDAAVSPIDALPEIVDAVKGKVAICVDSGFRRGSDAFKALALGADIVLLGRAPIYALAAGGEAGVTRALELLRRELKRTMAMCGCRSIAEVDASLIVRCDC